MSPGSAGTCINLHEIHMYFLRLGGVQLITYVYVYVYFTDFVRCPFLQSLNGIKSDFSDLSHPPDIVGNQLQRKQLPSPVLASTYTHYI